MHPQIGMVRHPRPGGVPNPSKSQSKDDNLLLIFVEYLPRRDHPALIARARAREGSALQNHPRSHPGVVERKEILAAAWTEEWPGPKDEVRRGGERRILRQMVDSTIGPG
jgi:hypothetical protein